MKSRSSPMLGGSQENRKFTRTFYSMHSDIFGLVIYASSSDLNRCTLLYVDFSAEPLVHYMEKRRLRPLRL